eukprot:9491642-Ditylum_brightwellii.AAC.1
MLPCHNSTIGGQRQKNCTLWELALIVQWNPQVRGEGGNLRSPAPAHDTQHTKLALDPGPALVAR